MKPTSVTVDGGWIAVRADFALKDHLKALDGARFSRSIPGWIDGPAWCYHADPATALMIRRAVPHISVADSAFLALVAEAEAVEAATTAAHADSDPEPLPAGVARHRPWRHQAIAYWQIRERRNVVVPMRMGTGKSAVIAWLIATPETSWRRVLIACPLSVCGVWPSQIATHAGRPARVVVLEGSVAGKAKRAAEEFVRDWPDPLVLVVNHESLWRTPLGAWVGRQTWDALIVDEGHRAKSPSGKLSMFLARVRPMFRYRIDLTGTPMPHSPLDIYAQGRFVNPDIFGTSFVRFRARHAVMGGYQQHQVVGYQNMDEFAERLAQLCTPVVRAEDVLDLPPVQHIRREVVLSPDEMRPYRELERDMIAEIAAGTVTASNALVKLLRLAQCCQGTIRTDDGTDVQVGTSKRDALADLLEDIDPAEPVVVFGRFHADLDSAKAAAERLGRRYGEVSGRDKGGLTSDSKMSPDVDVLGVQIQSGGVGIDLSRACYAVYLSTGYSLGDYEQSEARVHRPGQTRPTFYYHIVARGTVDEDIASALEAKGEVVEEVVAKLRAMRGGRHA